jgi:N-acyl-D-amino-acid deacylase
MDEKETKTMTQTYDLVIRNGKVVDGSGQPPFRGDVAIRGDLIAAIGDVDGSGTREIDATDRLVTPGFVDIHTHYDGHATWTDRLGPSSAHGVTTVVMGNCGVGFAPCKPEDRERLVRLMEGVEDIPEVVMTEGLPWDWTTFPEYLDRLAVRRFDMDIATQIPHAPLRVFVMGERAAVRDAATPQDIEQMSALVRQAIDAGALGFSTSRSLNHKASDGTLTPSYGAASDELAAIATSVGGAGTGVLQFISDFDDVEAEFAIARRMVGESGRPLSMSLIQFSHAPDRWREVLQRIDQANADGLDIKGQVCGRPIGVMLGFELSRNPFMHTAGWREVAHLPSPQRLTALRTPERRKAILDEFVAAAPTRATTTFANFDQMYEFDASSGYEPLPNQSVGARANSEGEAKAEYAYDLLAGGQGGTVFYIPVANYAGNSTEAIETMLASEHTILGLGDGGAHCGIICDASLPTYMIQRWSDGGAGYTPVEQVVRALTSETAEAVGLADRGRISVGFRADLNVINAHELALQRPRLVDDLPGGAGRLDQPALGYDATIVAGEVTYAHGEPTGALPGRLVRGARSERG